MSESVGVDVSKERLKQLKWRYDGYDESELGEIWFRSYKGLNHGGSMYIQKLWDEDKFFILLDDTESTRDDTRLGIKFDTLSHAIAYVELFD